MLYYNHLLLLLILFIAQDDFLKRGRGQKSARSRACSGNRTENKELKQKQASSSFSTQSKQMFS